jgi:Protein of unknown function (DUF2490)
MKFSKRILIYLICIILSVEGRGQTLVYNQFWNQYEFTKTLKGKWSLEFDIGQSWTGTPPDNKKMFTYYSQVYFRGWTHFHFSSRWRFSIFFAYFFNKYVPEINQENYPESRLALQATYFIIRKRYTLLTRMRLEDRHIQNSEGYMEGVYRFRNQLKFVYPFNGNRIRKGIIYGIASDELFFKTASSVTGSQFFDRNRFTAGAGYSVTNDIQVELTYVNDYLPRSPKNKVYNVAQLNVKFNNLLGNVYHRLQKRLGENNSSQ